MAVDSLKRSRAPDCFFHFLSSLFFRGVHMQKRTNYATTAQSRWAPKPSGLAARRNAAPAEAPPDKCSLCGFALVDDPMAKRMDFFSCTTCDATKTDFFVACHQCVRARWPEPVPVDYSFIIVLPSAWSVGCPRCDPTAPVKLTQVQRKHT